MRSLLLIPCVIALIGVGCGGSSTIATVSKEAEAQQAAQQKEADDAENAYQKEAGGIQEKGKKPKK